MAKKKKKVKPVIKNPKATSKLRSSKKIKSKVPLLQSGPMMETYQRPINEDLYNKADDSLKKMTGFNGSTMRQKVRMK